MKLRLFVAGVLLLLPAAAGAQVTDDERKLLDVLKRLRISGYIQPQYVRNERSADETTTGGTRNLDQFSIRRGRVKFTYQLTPTSRFVLQPDFATSGITLKDGYAELIEPWTSWRHTLTVGQFTWPFGFELLYSSSQREMPERSRVVRALFPGERDRGVMLSGNGYGQRLHYRGAIVNGTGTTQSFDFNARKDFVGRAGYSFESVDVAASVYRGAELVPLAGAPAGRDFEKSRLGADFQWRTPLRGLTLRGEYIRGVQPPAAGAAAQTADAADVAGWSVYALQPLGKRHQLVVRADEYDEDAKRNGGSIRTLGGAWLFQWDRTSRIMLAYERPRAESADVDDDVLTVRYQFSF